MLSSLLFTCATAAHLRSLPHLPWPGGVLCIMIILAYLFYAFYAWWFYLCLGVSISSARFCG